MQWLTDNLCSLSPLGRNVVNVVGILAALGLLLLAMKWHYGVVRKDTHALASDPIGGGSPHRPSSIAFWIIAVAWMTLGGAVMVGGGLLGAAMLMCPQPVSTMFYTFIGSALTVVLGAGIMHYAWTAR